MVDKSKPYYQYDVHPNGAVINTKTGNRMAINERHQVSLVIDGKDVMIDVRKLIYRLYVGPVRERTEYIVFQNEQYWNKYHYANLLKIDRRPFRAEITLEQLKARLGVEAVLIPEFEDYAIDELGRVWSLRLDKEIKKQMFRGQWHVVVTYTFEDGSRGSRRFRVQRLMDELFSE